MWVAVALANGNSFKTSHVKPTGVPLFTFKNLKSFPLFGVHIWVSNWVCVPGLQALRPQTNKTDCFAFCWWKGFSLDLFTSVKSMAFFFYHCLKSSIHKKKIVSQQKTHLQFLVFVLFWNLKSLGLHSQTYYFIFCGYNDRVEKPQPTPKSKFKKCIKVPKGKVHWELQVLSGGVPLVRWRLCACLHSIIPHEAPRIAFVSSDSPTKTSTF